MKVLYWLSPQTSTFLSAHHALFFNHSDLQMFGDNFSAQMLLAIEGFPVPSTRNMPSGPPVVSIIS